MWALSATPASPQLCLLIGIVTAKLLAAADEHLGKWPDLLETAVEEDWDLPKIENAALKKENEELEEEVETKLSFEHIWSIHQHSLVNLKSTEEIKSYCQLQHLMNCRD